MEASIKDMENHGRPILSYESGERSTEQSSSNVLYRVFFGYSYRWVKLLELNLKLSQLPLQLFNTNAVMFRHFRNLGASTAFFLQCILFSLALSLLVFGPLYSVLHLIQYLSIRTISVRQFAGYCNIL